MKTFTQEQLQHLKDMSEPMVKAFQIVGSGRDAFVVMHMNKDTRRITTGVASSLSAAIALLKA